MAEKQKVIYGVFDLPYLALRASSVRWRVHDYGIISVAPADLPLHKFLAVVNKPAHPCFGDAGNVGILLGPGNHALRGVYVGNMGPGCGSSQCGTSRISKEIKHLYLPGGVCFQGRTDKRGKPVPIGCLLRK